MSPAIAPRRILVIQLRRLGDVVVSQPIVEDLHAAFPDAIVDFLTGAEAAPLLREQPHIGTVLAYDRRHAVRMIRLVRARRYDCVVDVQSNSRTAALALFSGARVRVGWDMRGWGLTYTHRAGRRNPQPTYVVRDRQRLLQAIGVPVSPRDARLVLRPDERRDGELALIARGAPAGAARVGIVLSAGEPSKIWPVERFAAVAGALAAEGICPVIFETPGDAERVSRLRALTRAGIDAPIVDARDFLRMLSACDAFLSGDTGPSHMAMALDVPSVTIYGPRPPALWNPGRPTTLALWAGGVGCCELNQCVLDNACMKAVSTGAVLGALHRLLESAATPAGGAARGTAPASRAANGSEAP